MTISKIDIPKKAQYKHLAHDINFFELFQKIEERFETCYLLESLGELGGTSRYSVIGFDPMHIIRSRKNSLFVDNDEFKVENPYDCLQKMVPQDIITKKYAGGLFGYLSYESVNYFESTINVKVHDKFDQFMFGVYTDGLVLDKMTNELFYFFHDKDRSKEIFSIIDEVYISKGVSIEFLGDTMTKGEHETAVEKIKEYIKTGHTFQCEVGFKSEYRIKGNAVNIYEELRKVNPSPYMFYVKFGDTKIIGASPELLLRLSDGELETHPLAGTIGRGENDHEDVELARKLLNDSKEVAEHNMLVDLHRNDIGRVSKLGTVKVRRLMEIRKFSHVQHICSEIAGIIRPEEDMFSALSAILPGGVLSGAPKIETIKIIDRHEADARGPYGGAVGYFGFNGDCTFAIPIRSLFVKGDYAYTQTCSGIVYDSKPDMEYIEIENKLAAMKKTLSKFMQRV